MTDDTTRRLESLARIRETGQYAARNASKGAMLPELYKLTTTFRGRMQREALKHFVFNDNGLNKNTYENRRAIWSRLSYRYFSLWPEWIGEALAQAASQGIQSAEFLSLAYVYYVLRDCLTCDFIAGPLWQKWQAGSTHVSVADFAVYLSACAETSPEARRWSEETRRRLARNTLAALRDFGLLKGTQTKALQRPAVGLEAAYHLLAVLWAEGQRGRSLLQAPDWRIFLWEESDTAHALHRMAQQGWVRFERGGQTVILDLVRQPGETYA